jgi:hypothetical protein
MNGRSMTDHASSRVMPTNDATTITFPQLMTHMTDRIYKPSEALMTHMTRTPLFDPTCVRICTRETHQPDGTRHASSEIHR